MVRSTEAERVEGGEKREEGTVLQTQRQIEVLPPKKSHRVATRTQENVEQDVHIRAFEIYYGLKEGRTYKEVAAQLQIPVTTIQDWSKKWDWEGRLQARQVAIREAAEISSFIEPYETTLSRKRRILGVCDAILDKISTIDKDGKVHLKRGWEIDILKHLKTLSEVANNELGLSEKMRSIQSGNLYAQVNLNIKK